MTNEPKVSDTAESAVKKVAKEIAALIKRKPNAVLGLATGGTPIPLYKELARMHHHEGLSFRNVTTFNLDEYVGLTRSHPESYWAYMHKHFFNHIDIPAANIHLPSPDVAVTQLAAHCRAYEEAIKAAGGIDLQLLGIGRTGHMAFNEPGSPIDSRTRRVHLDEITRSDAVPGFGDLAHVPTHAITMGCGTILEASNIILMAFGQKKASIVKTALRGPITDQVTASFLQKHTSATYYLDLPAASAL